MVMSTPAQRRVVITGMGLIAPLGQTPEELSQALVERRSGVVPLDPVHSTPLLHYAGAATHFTEDIGNFGPLEADKKKAIRKGLKTLCRESIMGLAAAQRAWGHAGLVAGAFQPERAGVVFGTDYMLMDPEEFALAVRECGGATGQFDYARWVSDGFPRLFPLWLLRYLPNMPAAHLGIYNDLRGPSNSLTFREASANLAVGEAYRVVARGHADIMVAGATGTRIHPMKSIHAHQQEEISANGANPSAVARPFDLNRTGMVLGEGAGAIVLENYESAVARGATIHAEIVGVGSSTVATRQMMPQRDRAMANAMRASLRDAHASPDDVGHLQAHGLSTRSCDIDEARAIIDVFGSLADRLPVTALKSYMGNLGAGSGMVELIAGVLALSKGNLFPTLNYESPDPDCPIHVVQNDSTLAGSSFLNLNVTPQGQASCVMVRRLPA